MYVHLYDPGDVAFIINYMESRLQQDTYIFGTYTVSISIELYKHEWKFGRTRNAVGT